MNARLTYIYERYPVLFIIIAYMIFIICTNYYMFTNESISGGDGARVFPTIEFLINSKELYPLWNPYQGGGIPVLADPERFTWLSFLQPVDSQYKNIIFNLILLFEGALFGVSIYLLAKTFGLSSFPAFISGFIACNSQTIATALKSGRVEGLLVLTVVVFILNLFIKNINEPKFTRTVLLVVMVSYILSNSYYYAFVVLIIPMLFLGYYLNNGSASRRLFLTLKQITFYCMLGLILGAVIILPMIAYQIQGYAGASPIHQLADNLPKLYTIINMFVPIDIQKQHIIDRPFNFYSLLILPCFYLYIRTLVRVGKISRHEKALITIIIVSLLFVLGRAYPFKYLVELLSSIPIIGHIRWANPFYYLILVSGSVLAGYGIDRALKLGVEDSVTQLKVKGVLKQFIISIPIIISGLLILWGVDTLSNNGKPELNKMLLWLYSGIFSLEAGISIISIIIAWYLYRCRGYKIKNIISSLVLVQLMLIHPYSESKRVYEQQFSDEILNIYNNDKTYYSTFLPRNKLGASFVRNHNYDSLYVSGEYKRVIQHLIGVDFKHARNDYIIQRKNYHKWDPVVLELMNVKYIYVGNNSRLPPNWRRISKNIATQEEWKTSLKLFTKWEYEPDPDRALKKYLKSKMRGEEKIYIDDKLVSTSTMPNNILKYSIDIKSYTSDEVVINVSTNEQAILLFPEYYDKYWELNLNGMNQKIYRANGSYRGIKVEPGTNTIIMKYKPTVYYIGIVITVVTMVTLILILLLRNNRKSGIEAEHQLRGS